MKTRKKTVLIITVGIALLSVLVWFKCQTVVWINCQNVENCERMSPRGAVVFSFSRPVDPEKVEKHWQTSPPIAGRWEWFDEKTGRWSPLKPLLVGSQVTFTFTPGEFNLRGGRLLIGRAWQVTIRPSLIVGLGAGGNGTELFILDPQAKERPRMITHTGGRVIDYAPSLDGEWIAFSVENDVGGWDLWITERDGKNAHLLLKCHVDRCRTPAWSPSGRQIAYTREITTGNGRNGSSFKQIWVVDTQTRETSPLPHNNDFPSDDAIWSPDGRWISLWNQRDKRIELIGLDSGNLIHLETANGNTGCWSADGRFYYFSGLIGGEGQFQNLVYQVDVSSKKVSVVLGEAHERERNHLGEKEESEISHLSVDYPACDPSEGWLAARIQPNVNIPGYELIAYHPEIGEIITIMQDFSRTIGAYSWSPDGRQLVLQTFPLGGDLEDIMIWVYNRESDELLPISSGFRNPKWLP